MSISLDFFKNLNKKFGAIDKKALAEKMLQGNVDAGHAIVSILDASGIAGFRFHVPESETIKLENDITDHYIESNTAVQDHIAQKPVSITLSGYVGDYFYSNHKIADMVSQIVTTVKLVQSFLPDVSEEVQKAKINKSKATLGSDDKLAVKDYYGIYKNQLNDVDIFALMQSLYKFKSAQTRAFLFFEALWKSRTLFTVETSWKRFDNMAIQSMTARRDNNADITEFSITFKQITLTQTLIETVEEYQNRTAMQRAKVTNKGLSEGTLMSIDDVSFA